MATTDAKEFTTGTLDLGDGIVLSRKLRLVGMLYLEAKYDLPMAEIMPRLKSLAEGGRMDPVLDMLVAMMLSNDPDLDPEDARKRLGRLDADDLDAATEIIKAGTETGDEPEPEKNVQEPTGQ